MNALGIGIIPKYLGIGIIFANFILVLVLVLNSKPH